MTFFKRILVVLLSVFILSVSVGNSFLSTKSISRVYAYEILAEEAVEVSWELVAAFLSSIGAGAYVISCKDAIMEEYINYIDRELDMGEMIVDGALNIFDSASGAICSIQWDKYIDILKDGFKDYDPLTGIYAQYSPYLINYIKGYVSSIIDGDIVIDGFPVASSDSFVSESTILEQWTGDNYLYTSQILSVSPDGIETFTINLSVYCEYPMCAILEYHDSGYVSKISFYQYLNNNLSTKKLSGTYRRKNSFGDTTVNYDQFYVTNYNNYSFSYSLNFPVFNDDGQALNYFRTGSLDGALNVIDNDDLPLWDIWSKLWERVAEATDFGIGSFGEGVSVNDWADDIPFVGLDDLRDYVDEMEDVFDGVRDGIIDVDDPAFDDSLSDAWDDVIDGSIPSDEVADWGNDKDSDKDKDKDDSVDTPVEDVDIPSLIPDASSEFSGIPDMLKKKFPFSLPWDLYSLLLVLSDTPKTPIFKLPFVIQRYDIHETIVIDMTDYEEISIVSRFFFSLIFAYALMNWTVKIVSVVEGD